MKKYTIVFLFLVASLYATTMQELFEALRKNPTIKLDEINLNRAKLDEDKVYSKLYPKLTIFGKYDNFSTPTGSVPIPPNTLIDMVQDPSIGQPFGYNIYRLGGSFSMPLFVKSIYTFGDQAKLMKASSKAQKKINLLQNEAVLVGTNANLLYLQHLSISLKRKASSLKETQKFIKIKVDTGRSAESELYKIEDAVMQIDINLNNISLQEQNAFAQIETLTEIKLTRAIKMQAKEEIKEGTYQSLEPLRIKSLALKYAIKAQQEKRWWPSLSANGSYTRNYTKAYNNGDDIYENYGQVGVLLSFPLFDEENNVAVDEAKISSMQVQTKLEKEKLKLDADAKAMLTSLDLLSRSTQLYTKSVVNKKRLRDIAKVSFTNGRMDMEDYLKYEDDLVAEEAKLYQTQAQLWQIKMKLAVIYGNNIQEMIR